MTVHNRTASIGFVKRYEVYLLWWWFSRKYIITEKVDELLD